MLASQNGHYQVVELLLKEQAQADVNLQANNGFTALMSACLTIWSLSNSRIVTKRASCC
jgi:ankyrin repeat protein